MNYDDRAGDWIITYRGNRFYPLDPREEDIDIRDIAHSLSLLCRFNGHCREFYSVAEHSVRVYEHFVQTYPDTDGDYGVAIRVLLHDAAEAYMSDLPRPVKRQYPDYKIDEDRALQVIYNAFQATDALIKASTISVLVNSDNKIEQLEKMIKRCDSEMLMTEARELELKSLEDWSEVAKPIPDYHIIPLSSKEAESWFLEVYRKIAANKISDELYEIITEPYDV